MPEIDTDTLARWQALIDEALERCRELEAENARLRVEQEALVAARDKDSYDIDAQMDFERILVGDVRALDRFHQDTLKQPPAGR